MKRSTRRDAIKSLLLGAPAVAAASGAVGAAPAADAGDCSRRPLAWARGVENQRKADLGDGTFLNPVIAGDHADPSILKDGDDYYLTHSSFDMYPGLLVRHSRDLVNWRPLGPALKRPVGSVWAPDLVKHRGRFFIYLPTRTPSYRSTYVIHAEKPDGPWSEPIDLKLPDHIDPGHAIGEDGGRYLFLSGGDRVRLTDDGLATAGPVEHVYDPWRYPEGWDVESFSPEGPKVSRHGEWFYLITAVGGTAGPPTGHMVIAARSRSIHGPWEHAPGSPLVRTQTAAEKWWSRGHATLVEGPGGDWWMMYHGYENGFWTLGRQTLLDPIEWTTDGWFRAKGGDLSRPIRKPKKGTAVVHGTALSDDFTTNRFGVVWGFYAPAPDEMQRLRYDAGALVLRAKGSEPRDSSPLTCIDGAPGVIYVTATGARHSTLQSAVDALPAQGGEITLSPGVYREKVAIDKPNVRLQGVGARPQEVVIAWGDGAVNVGGTFKSATLNVTGDNFRADNLTIQNDYSLRSTQPSQAAALSVTGDRAVITRVRMLGAQDTLYAASRKREGPSCRVSRQYFRDCYIEGHVDFIFGDSKAFFDRCEIHVIPNKEILITAHARTAVDQDRAYVFDHCAITADSNARNVYLGRPWRDYAAVVFMNTHIDADLHPEGWREWHPGETQRLLTAYYAEYRSSGRGANASGREPHARQLSDAEARRWSLQPFLAGG